MLAASKGSLSRRSEMQSEMHVGDESGWPTPTTMLRLAQAPLHLLCSLWPAEKRHYTPVSTAAPLPGTFTVEAAAPLPGTLTVEESSVGLHEVVRCTGAEKAEKIVVVIPGNPGVPCAWEAGAGTGRPWLAGKACERPS